LNLDQFRNYCLSKKSTKESTPFDEQTLVMKVAGKIFAITNIDDFASINLKVDPEYGIELRERYNSIQPAFHMNKKHWISVLNDGKVGDKFLKELIDQSYSLVVSKLSKRDRLSIEP
jgi:predicted DNA-binding protein (MmcQ/YjbR family)